MSDQPLKVTSVADYRKKREEGSLLSLPSGAVFRLRKPSMGDFFKQATGSDAVPDLFAALIMGQSPGQGQAMDAKSLVVALPEMVEKVIVATVVEPPVAIEASDNTLVADDIGFDDQVAILSFVMGDYASASNFLGQQR